KGTPVGEQEFPANVCFLLTDHIPMPKKSFNSLKRLGAAKISRGPRMLFASQGEVLIHNALDKRELAQNRFDCVDARRPLTATAVTSPPIMAPATPQVMMSWPVRYRPGMEVFGVSQRCSNRDGSCSSP